MDHQFGNISSWTADKLQRIKSYLDAYQQALKNQPFKLEYIDAFAGTGYIHSKITIRGELLFDQDETLVLKDFIDGSARVALQSNPPFSRYTFIEKHQKRCIELENLKTDFPDLAGSISVICGEANIEIKRLCDSNWIAAGRRGVMFLDPYGTQVSWETIRLIAETRAIDLWILFPIGAVNRLLNRDGHIIKVARKRRLDVVFGESGWFDTFYERSEPRPLLPDDTTTTFRKTSDPFGAITKYFIERLGTVFAEVAANPLQMKNSSNSPIFLLCFAAGNPKGAPIAVKIAQHILGKR